ncbi:hypothetical protein Bbu156a_0328 [Borreliella burgdorferi 156a]|nr:hypothetical protein Bbu156a_0328 [Borreliella burgdorferi 156a]
MFLLLIEFLDFYFYYLKLKYFNDLALKNFSHICVYKFY